LDRRRPRTSCRASAYECSPVNRIGDAFVRPHDVQILAEDDGSTIEALVKRVVHLGFEVRVELELAGDGAVAAQLTRHEAEQLELAEGDIVYVRPDSAPAADLAATA